MIHFGLKGVEFIAVNTDVHALGANTAAEKIAIGSGITRGLGAGADPERGRDAALQDTERLMEALHGADLVFVIGGMGGGTGTGAAPVIARLAREVGALTVGIVTRPFRFEGQQRARRAERGLLVLAEHVDTLITIPNEKLMSGADADLTFVEAFRKADEALFHAVKGISDLIMLDGIVNVDFADVRMVMAGTGRAVMGTGRATGDGRARLAAERAITSPLLDDVSVAGATGVLINVVGGNDMKMREIQEAASLIQEQAHEDANIIFGASIDESLTESLIVTVIATGFPEAHDLSEVVEQQLLPEKAEGDMAMRQRDSTLVAADATPDSLSLFFDMATISPQKAGLVIRALEKVFGTELKIVRTRPLPPGKTGPRSSNDTQLDASAGL
jgi:cell division protein FtsZ